jgi:phosphoribosylanthranilate isomerase
MCGMTRAVDIEQAITLGVDAIGLIFYSKSSRFITIEHAKKILLSLPPFVNVVGVFVNPEISVVNHVISELPIHYLQFHGEETPAFCEQFNKPYIKALAAASKETIIKATNIYQSAAAILLDTPSTNNHGGTGVPFDWQIIPEKLMKPMMLAGGLNASNIKAAITVSDLYAVDVCSGIEERPGIKDHKKMRQFVEAVTRGFNE